MGIYANVNINFQIPDIISFTKMCCFANLHRFCTKMHSEPDYVGNTTTSGLSSLSTTSSNTSSDAETDVESRGEMDKSSFQPKRARINIITPRLAAALDRSGMSSRDATYVLAEKAKSLGHNIADININSMSIHRHCQIHRSRYANDLKEHFTVSVPLVVHWKTDLKI